MKVTYKDLNDANLNAAMTRLGNAALPPKVAYNISKIQYKLDQELKILRKLFLDLVKKHAELDDKGKVKEPQGPGSFQVRKEALELWQKEYEELMGIEFDLDAKKCRPISFKELGDVKVTPYEIAALEPLLTDLEALEVPPGPATPASRPGLQPVAKTTQPSA